MWHVHPQQQQRGIQFEPPRPIFSTREAHSSGEKAGKTLHDMNGAPQQGFAKPRDPQPAR